MNVRAPEGRLLEEFTRGNAGPAETGRSSRLRKLYESLDSDLRRSLRLLRTLDWKESLGRGRLPVEEPAVGIVVLYLVWRTMDGMGVVPFPVTVRNRWTYRHRCLDFVDPNLVLFSSSSVRFARCIIPFIPSHPQRQMRSIAFFAFAFVLAGQGKSYHLCAGISD
jgi:hypothetical protein